MTAMTMARSDGLRPLAAALGRGLRPHRPDPPAGAGALPAGLTRWGLVAALRGAAPGLGITPPMLRLIELYVDLGRDIDWAADAEPVVPVPVAELAEALGRSERQVRSVEAQLAAAGLIVFRDSGNHHRRGRRCPRTGRLLWAYGPSLAPLRARAAGILAAAADARAGRAEARRLRLAISALRRQARVAIAAAGDEALAATFAALPERAPAGTPLAELDARRAALLALLDACEASGSAGEPEVFVRHDLDTPLDWSMNGRGGTAAMPDAGQGERGGNRTMPGKGVNHARGSAPGRPTAGPSVTPKPEAVGTRGGPGPAPADPGRAAGLDRIGLRLALSAASPALSGLLPARPGWSDLVDAAVRLAPGLGIAPALWVQACGLLGRRGAAICLIVTERAAARSPGGRHAPVDRPGAYFRALLARAGEGRLDLPRSLHGHAAPPPQGGA